MLLIFHTLSDKKYSVKLETYKAKPFKKVASDFQFKWKRFWMNKFPQDFWTEEFPCRPNFRNRYRLDLFNFTRKFAVECHGAQHVRVSNHFHGGSQIKFLDNLVKDREKELWCERNGIVLITLYDTTPYDLSFFQQKYPNIRWK
jgi:hypothetical protein